MALEWITETLRLSLFCAEDVKITPANWKAITDQDEPQTQQSFPARRIFSGPFQGGVLNLSAVGSRIDCVLLPKFPSATIDEGYVPTVGAWPDAGQSFVVSTSAWLAAFEQPIYRLAFGGSLLTKCAGLQDAYTQLLGMLQSVKGDPERMRELIYRVSWPLNSRTVDGLILHRITTWAALQIQLQLMMQTGTKTMTTGTPATTYVVRLELDHSTDAERTEPFDRGRLVPIYEELVALASENAEKGEVL
jgi:hypothetical protein